MFVQCKKKCYYYFSLLHSTFYEKLNSQKFLLFMLLCVECPGVTFHLPRDNQVTDYIRYRDYVPSMKDATACAWVETSDFSDHATVWSYAPSARVNNEFFLAFLNPSTVRIAKSNLLLDFPVTRMTGSKKVTKTKMLYFFNAA